MSNETRRTDPANPSTCGLCGEPMPPGEEMFNYHGYSGPCPKPAGDKLSPTENPDTAREVHEALTASKPAWIDAAAKECADHVLVGAGHRTFAEIIERHARQ